MIDKVTPTLTLGDKEISERQSAIGLGNELIREAQHQFGRDWLNNKKNLEGLARDWLKRIYAEEVLTHGISATGGGQELLNHLKAIDDPGCSVGCQKGSHFCRFGVTSAHPTDKKFPCNEMLGICCLQHASTRLCQNFQARMTAGSGDEQARIAEMVEYDHRREVSTAAATVVRRSSELKRTIFRCVNKSEWDLSIVLPFISGAKAGSSTAAITKTAPLLDGCDWSPGAKSGRPQTPFALHASLTLRAVTGSVDLFHQFCLTTGVPMGHQVTTCKLVPTWFQMAKKASVPLITACLVAQIHIEATQELKDGSDLIDQLSTLMRALAPLDVKYKDAAKTSLTLEERALAIEASNILREEWGDQRPQFPRLQASMSALSPIADPVSTLIASYSGSTSLSGLARLQKRQDGTTTIAATLWEDRKSVQAMSPSMAAEVARDFAAEADIAARKYGAVQALKTNAEGMPTLWFPTTTKTRDLCLLAVLVWWRAVACCDLGCYTLCGVVYWRSGSWRRVLRVWIIHYCKYGDRDIVAGAQFDFATQGSHHHPTLLAHTAHRMPFFHNPVTGVMTHETDLDVPEAANATVQCRGVNYFIKSMRLTTIESILHVSRLDFGRLFIRLRAAGLLNIQNSQINAILNRANLLSAEQAKILANNGREPGELPGRFSTPDPDSQDE